jgi:formylglycine-generating enzyme required for sulfatase activity
MILISAGWFWMGADTHYTWESPRHRVFVDSFWVAQTAVTRSEYCKFLDATGHPQPRDWNDSLFGDPHQPVVGVNWFDVTAYCEWYSQLRGERYRLPSEAEWEKACRGGLEGAEYAWGNESPDAFDYFHGVWQAPRPVCQWRANGYSLHNLGDNVHEWCSDWFDPAYYANSPENNPTGPESGTRRVSRGGSWRHRVKASRAAHRSSLPPAYRYTDYGFRLVKDE